MNGFAAIAATIAVLLPAIGSAPSREEAARITQQEAAGPTAVADPSAEQPWRTYLDAFQPSVQGQVRIEQRVTIRISPQPGPGRTDLMASLPPGEVPVRYEERIFGKCLPLKDIVGVQPNGDDRLVLYTRGRTMISAALEKACRAKDFYSGFYVEKSEDGMLCVKRDKLQSRTGANCQVKLLSRLVAVRD